MVAVIASLIALSLSVWEGGGELFCALTPPQNTPSEEIQNWERHLLTGLDVRYPAFSLVEKREVEGVWIYRLRFQSISPQPLSPLAATWSDPSLAAFGAVRWRPVSAPRLSHMAAPPVPLEGEFPPVLSELERVALAEREKTLSERNLRYIFSHRFPWLEWGSIGIFGLLAVTLWGLWPRRRPSEKPKEIGWRDAVAEAIARLEKMPLEDPDDREVYLIELVHVVRRVLGEGRGIAVEGLTTEELRGLLNPESSLDRSLIALFEEADRVKFAGLEVSDRAVKGGRGLAHLLLSDERELER